MKLSQVIALLTTILAFCSTPLHAQCSISASLAAPTDPAYKGAGLQIISSGGVANGAVITLFRDGIQFLQTTRSNANGPLNTFFSFQCFRAGDYTWTVVGTCQVIDEEGRTVAGKSALTTGGPYTVPLIEIPPTFQAQLLNPAQPTGNVAIDFAFPPGAGDIRSIRIEPGLSERKPSEFAGQWIVNLAPGQYTLTMRWCTINNTRESQIPFTVPQPATTPPVIRFELTDASPENDRKVLIHKYGISDAYPSPWQTTDGNVEVQATVVDNTGAPLAGKQVYFRVVDPPDAAPYVTNAGDARAGDNKDTASTAGVVAPGSAVSDAHGKVKTTLTISDHVAGDNYRIRAGVDPRVASDPAYVCAAGCAESGVLTAWKRIYLEKATMFRSGSFIRGLADAHQTHIPVDNPGPFRALSRGAILRLLHAPPSITNSVLPSSFYYNDVLFDQLARRPGGGWDVLVQQPLPRAYGTDKPITTSDSAVSSLSDAIGVVSAGVFECNFQYLAGLYGQAYVDVQEAPVLYHEYPFLPEDMDNQDQLSASRKWLQNAKPNTTRANPNVLHAIGANKSRPHPNTSTRDCIVSAGVTAVWAGSNASYTFVGRIEEETAGSILCGILGRKTMSIHSLDPVAVNGETTTHELVHSWRANPPPDGTGGHCKLQRYRHDGKRCLMHENVDNADHGLADGAVDLHYERGPGGGVNSEYVTIRHAAEPIPQ
jgi:hypothetical protein